MTFHHTKFLTLKFIVFKIFIVNAFVLYIFNKDPDDLWERPNCVEIILIRKIS